MRGKVFLQGLISFLIIAFGQPSFTPWLGPVAAILGYALFWRAIRIYPFRRQRFWRGTLWYGAASLIQLSWMSAIEFQGIYILVVWLALSIWLGIQFGLLSIMIPYNRHLTFGRILAIASVWTLFEWSRYQVLCGYSWNLSGVALSNTYAIQLASVLGILGLSFWVIFVNLLGLRAFLRKGIHRYLVWIGAAAIPYLFGMAHISYHNAQIAKEKETFSCLLVQTGLLPPEKVPLQGRIRSFVSPYDQWKRILLFLKEKQEMADLIVLPEASVPFTSDATLYDQRTVENIFYDVYGPIASEHFPRHSAPYAEEGVPRVSNAYWAQTLANLAKSEVILGLDHVEPNGQSYNSAFHVRPEGQFLDRYDKRVLMPLAEYLPFKWLLPLVKSYGISEFFTHGKEANLFHGKLPMSVSICYEETFPNRVREGRLEGAKLLVNVTNDGWYPYTRLPSQHYEHAKFRAVENGTALVRACNTGVTCAIDSLGRTLSKLPPYDAQKNIESGTLHATFTPYEHPTFYLIWGNAGIVTLCCVFLGIFLLFRKALHL